MRLHVSFSDGVANPVAPKRVAWTADFGGSVPIDREIREICTKMARRFEELGCIVEEASPDFGPVDEVFMALRSQQFVVDRELQIQQHRDKFKPDIIWNTELGLKQTPAGSPGPSASAPRCTGAWSSSSRSTICW